jgi:hypothetical protein
LFTLDSNQGGRKRDKEKREGKETERDRELERFLPSFCYNFSNSSIKLLSREIHRRRRRMIVHHLLQKLEENRETEKRN